MNRLKYFEDTLKRCESAFKAEPSIFPLEWIINQLRYLIDVEKGNISDFSELDKIKIGWIAVREMDGYEDKDLINALCVISEEANKMLLEKKLSNNKITKK